MSKKHDLKYVKELFLSFGCEFLDDFYGGVSFLHKYKCRCGNINCKKSVNNLKLSWRCKRCRYEASSNSKRYSLEEIKKYFADRGCVFLDDWYKDNINLHNYICECGKQGMIRFCNFYKGKRCTDCAGNTKLNFENIKKMFEDAGCKLLSDKYEGALKPLKYICVCGCEANGYVRHFRNGRRCYNCNPVFNRISPSYLYLVSNSHMLKIGIYNEDSRRLKEHKVNLNFDLLDLIGPIKGTDAELIENTILECLDIKKISRGKSLFNKPFDGYTECWLKKDLNVSSIQELWDAL